MLALMIASQVIAGVYFARSFSNGVQSIADLIAEIIGFLSICPGLWVWLQFWCKRPFWLPGFEHRCVRQRLLRGALAAGSMVSTAVGLLTLLATTVIAVSPKETGLIMRTVSVSGRNFRRYVQRCCVEQNPQSITPLRDRCCREGRKS
jgi:hypothetical protein